MRTSPAPDPGDRRSHSGRRRKDPGLRRAWCCSFGVVPQSPDNYHRTTNTATANSHHHSGGSSRHHHPSKNQKGYAGGSFNSSPSPNSKIGRGLIDPRRILSPGRVSPIDSDAALGPLPECGDAASVAATTVESEVDFVDPAPKEEAVAVTGRFSSSSTVDAVVGVVGGGGKERSLDLRLALKGKDGRFMVLELDSGVLCENSSFFAEMVVDSRRKVSDALVECRKIEVANIADLGVFKETIELMYEKDVTRWLLKAGVSRAIDVLEVSSTISFDRGVMSCLKYLEAVPWSESEEEKLKSLFTRCTFDETINQDMLSRLYSQGPIQSENLALHLVQSVASGNIASARKEMQSLVNGLLSKSSVYQKDPAGFNKEGLYSICFSCLNLLVELFEEASGMFPVDQTAMLKKTKPLIERISQHVDSLNWLLEILIEKQMAEEFVGLWASQNELLRMHELASPMVRYELSRISACVFIALGRGRLQCRGDVRYQVLRSWFGPILSDFGWLQRCSKGLDMRMLEEALGQALLTLSLKQQESLLVEWFRCFAGRGTECPNLSRAFQVWWRRSFVRPSEARGQLPRDFQNVLYEL